MLRVEVWDEISPINGVEAERIFEMRDDLARARGDIFLVKQGEQVMQIEIGAIIKGNYGFDSNLSIQEVAEQYLAKREEEEAKAQEEQMTVDELQEEVAMLSFEVMFMQGDAPAMLALNEGEHSAKFKSIRVWFRKGFWNEAMLEVAVEKGWLKEEEKIEILGE